MNTVSYYKSIALESLSEVEYDNIKEAGMLYSIYPEATGMYKEDVMSKRIDNIGQNGNDGYHYGCTNEPENLYYKEPVMTFSDKEIGNPVTHYRVSGSDNPNAWGYDVYNDHKWKHVHGDSYSDKIKKAIEETYEPEEDHMMDGDDMDDILADKYPPRGMDMVSQPRHYMLWDKYSDVQDVIQAVLGSQEALDWLTPYEGGQYTGVIERILRAPKKDGLQDLQKAHKQLGWLIESLEGME